MTTRDQGKKQARWATLGLGIAAAALWGASRLTWLKVDIFDDKSGEASHDLVGAVWSTEQSAIALLLLASVVAALALRRLGRRLIGVVAAVGALVASWSPMQLLSAGADPERVKSILTSGAASQRSTAPVSVTEWAQITGVHTEPLGPTLALVASALALLAGVVVALRPGTDSPRTNRFEAKKTRQDKLAADLAEDPGSHRVMWDAIDADVDPTDTARSTRDF